MIGVRGLRWTMKKLILFSWIEDASVRRIVVAAGVGTGCLMRANELFVWGCHGWRDGWESALSAVRGDPIMQDGVESVDDECADENRIQY